VAGGADGVDRPLPGAGRHPERLRRQAHHGRRRAAGRAARGADRAGRAPTVVHAAGRADHPARAGARSPSRDLRHGRRGPWQRPPAAPPPRRPAPAPRPRPPAPRGAPPPPRDEPPEPHPGTTAPDARARAPLRAPSSLLLISPRLRLPLLVPKPQVSARPALF